MQKRNNMFKAAVVFAVALAFIMPGSAAFANVGTIGVTTNIENNVENIDTTDVIEQINTEEPNTPSTIGTTIYVDDDNTGGPWDGTMAHPYRYIQDAIDNGADGDTVYVFNGRYNEGYYTHPSVEYEGLTAYKPNMTFIGESKGNVIVDPVYPVNQLGNAMKVYADGVTMENFVFANATHAQFQYGIMLGGWNSRKQRTEQANNCIFINCTAENDGYGIALEESSNNQFINCDVINSYYYGIELRYDSSGNTFSDCTVDYVDLYQGIYAHGATADNEFIDCVITDSARNGVRLYEAENTKLINCEISNIATILTENDEGMWLQYCPDEKTEFRLESVDEDNRKTGVVNLKDEYGNQIVVPACSIPESVQPNEWVLYSFDDNKVLETTLDRPRPLYTYAGLLLEYSPNVQILNCTITDDLSIEYSSYCTMSNTTLTDSELRVVGEGIPDYDHDIDTTNTLDGDPIYYLSGESDTVIDGTTLLDVGYLGLVSCTNVTVKNMVLTNMYQGLIVVDTTDSTIQNCNLSDNDEGLNILYDSSDNEILDCYLSGNYFGLTLANALDNNKFRDNELVGNTYSFAVSGETEVQFDQDIDTSNTIDGKAIAYIVGASTQTYDNPDVGFLALISCDNITLKNFVMSDNTQGVLLGFTVDSTIQNCTLNGNGDGYVSMFCSDNTIVDCDFSNNVYSGAYLIGETDATISNCTFNNDDDGIWGIDSEYNEITDCAFTDCGIFTYYGGFSNNTISDCTFDGGYSALWFYHSSNDNYVSNCSITGGTFSVLSVYGSCGNQYVDCDIIGNYVGVEWHHDAHGMSLIRCNISDNYNGYYPIDANDCEIVDSTMFRCDAAIPTDNVNNHRFINLVSSEGEFGYGIGLNGDNATITGCNISYSGWPGDTLGIPAQGGGITIMGENAILRDNELWQNVNNLGVDGHAHDIDTSNTIDDKPIYYLVGVTDTILDATDAGFVGLSSCNNVTVKNADLYNVSAIVLGDTTNSAIENCSTTATYDGIQLEDSSNNVIQNCDSFANWFYSISMGGDSHDNLVCNYTMINSKSYHGILWSGEESPYDNTFMNCYLDGTKALALNGIYLMGDRSWNRWVNGTTFIGCTILNVSANAIYVNHASGTTITGCTLTDATKGIALYYGSGDSYVSDCDLSNNLHGGYYNRYSAEAYPSINNVITGCLCANNVYYGICILGVTSDNLVTYNTVRDNSAIGIYLREPTVENTYVYGNNVINNSENGHDKGLNFWDDGVHGNYWDDYTGSDSDGDGIGDTPYNISGEGERQDRYPKMMPYPNKAPVAAFTWSPLSPVTNEYVTFDPSASYDPDDTIATWYWTFGDGYTSTDENPIHAYDTAGTYAVVLKVTDHWDASSTVQQNISISTNKAPVADAGPDQIVDTRIVSFDASGSNDPDGTIISYKWEFGDDTTGTGETANHLYTTDGTFAVILTVTDNGQATDSDVCIIVIDTVDPETQAILSGTEGENDWYISPVEVTLFASDDRSGIAETWYRTNGNWIEYTTPFEVSDDDEYTLDYYSVDNAGNEETVNSVDFKIDSTPPTINLTAESIGIAKWLFTATVNDETSGVAMVEFYLDGELLGNVTTSPYEWEWSGMGRHTVRAIVYDNAGLITVSPDVGAHSQNAKVSPSKPMLGLQLYRDNIYT